MNAVALLMDGRDGVFIPCLFANEFDVTRWGLDPDGWEVTQCKDAESEFYWDAWGNILEMAEFHNDGHVWRLWQDGDLWAVCPELMTDEEKTNFGWEE